MTNHPDKNAASSGGGRLPWAGVELRDPEGRLSTRKAKELKIAVRMRDHATLADPAEKAAILARVAIATSGPGTSLDDPGAHVYRSVDFEPKSTPPGRKKKKCNQSNNDSSIGCEPAIVVVTLGDWGPSADRRRRDELVGKLRGRISQKRMSAGRTMVGQQREAKDPELKTGCPWSMHRSLCEASPMLANMLPTPRAIKKDPETYAAMLPIVKKNRSVHDYVKRCINEPNADAPTLDH